MSRIFLVLTSCLQLGNCQNIRQIQKFEREPEDQTAVVGETVVMACRVLHKGGVLQWTKDDFGLGSDRNLSGFERYSMIGSDEEGKKYFLLTNISCILLGRRNSVAFIHRQFAFKY